MGQEEDSGSTAATSSFAKMADVRSDQGASTTHSEILFEEVIPVHIKEHDKQERVEQLGFRISLCTTQKGHNMVKVEKVLKLQLTSEKDSFFLHSLVVTEDSFQRLKHDQSILVDFTDFPSHLIALLDQCIQAKQDVQPKFLCVLNTSKPKPAAWDSLDDETSSEKSSAEKAAIKELFPLVGTSVVGIVETNQFKHLCHISMKFQPGNDTRIKEYLSQRLSEVRAANSVLTSQLGQSRENVAQLSSDLKYLKEDFASEQQARKEQNTHWSAEKQTLLTDCKEELMSEVSELKKKHEKEKAALEAEFKAVRDQLSDSNSKLDERVRNLQDEKFSLDAKSREPAVKVESLESDLKLSRELESELKQSNLDLDSGKHQAEKQANHLMLKVASLEATMKEKEALITTLKDQQHAGEQSTSALQGSFAEMKLALQRAEERATLSAQEVNKGNQIIDKLQNDLKSARSKAKLKSQVITQQENLLQEKQSAMDKLGRDAMVMKSQMEALSSEKSTLTSQCDDQKEKLKEAKKVLGQNQQMIQWLNNQINESQIAKYGGTSRFAFRPTRTLATPPSSAETT